MEAELKIIRLAHGIDEAKAELADVLGELDVKRAVLVVGPNVAPITRKTVEFLEKSLRETVTVNPTSNCESEVDAALDRSRDLDCDAVIGIGGGRTIDVAKMTGNRLGCHVISFPTLVSHDGIASPVAVLLDGKGRKQSLPARMPVAVVVDLEIIGRAPISSIRAGVGDLVSNFSAIEDWKLGAKKTGEKYHDLAAVMSHAAASSIFEMTEIGETYARHPEFIRRLAQGLILSGVAMSIAGSSRPASGAEHNISHAIDALYNLPAYHGEQVALGAVFTTFVRGGPWEKFLTFCHRLGLPVTSLDIGLSESDYVRAIIEAPRTRKGRHTILDEVDLSEASVKSVLAEIRMRLTG